jgi:proteasome assembly chaperone (PAC2) family protein
MENDYIIFLDEPQLREPVLVYALEGWIDAGLGAQSALNNLLSQVESEVVAKFDTEYFIDQRARRPTVRISDGVTTELVWPEIELRVGKDRDGADLLILVGPEPDFHWSDFVEAVTDTADHFGVRLVIGLGAFPAPTPHTRPLKVIATAPADSEHLLPLVGTVEGELEVPAGISAAIELGCADVEIDVLTLWARVPHYVASMPYPQAAAALIDTLARVAGLSLDSTGLQTAADETRLRVDNLVTNNPEHAAMVEDLESIADENEGTSFGDSVPEPEELSAELDRFLRGEGF